MKGVFGQFIGVLKHILLIIVHGLKRITCIGKRKKVLREDDPTSVVVIAPTIPETPPKTPYGSSNLMQYPSKTNEAQQEAQMQDWNSWDNGSFDVSPNQVPTTIYSSNAPDLNEKSEAEIDFFKDMVPTVKVKKVLVKKKTNQTPNTNRLAMDRDLDFKVSDELEEWKDEDEDGWSGEGEEDFEIDEALILREAHERRKLERQERAKQQRHQKTIKTHDKLGLKVS